MIIELLSFLGLIFGFFLYKFTKEEFNTGRKYFILLNRIILFVIIIFLIYYSNLNLLLTVLLFIFGVVVSYFFGNIYLYLGLVVSSYSRDLFSILVFLFGFPYGTLNSRKGIKFVRNCLIFFIVGLSGFLLTSYTNYLSGFLAGALFFKLISKEII